MALRGSGKMRVAVLAALLLATAAMEADPAVCADCKTASEEEDAVLLQAKKTVQAHDVGEEPPHQMGSRPPAFVLALAAKDAADKAAKPSPFEIDDDFPHGASLTQQELNDQGEVAGWYEPLALEYVVAFTPYYSYEGNLKVQGRVAIQGTGLLNTAAQTLSWQLSGVDPKCKTTPAGVKNACGIHIHEGTSCYENAGAHYFDRELFSVDPWATVTYKTSKFAYTYFAVEAGTKVVTGLTNYDVLGHTVIVHDHTGARVACGIIIPKKLAVPAFTRYFNYHGPLEVMGAMAVMGTGVADDAGQTLSWNLMGVDPRCKNGGDSAFSNSCGVHIHEGTSCTDDALGHYWNKTTYQDDPWSPVDYYSHKWFNSKVYTWQEAYPVVTGLETTLVNGHTMIVHNYTGGRIGCGIIAPCTEVANAFVPYYNYKGDLEVSGWVKVLGSGVLEDASQVLTWSLSGVDPVCSTAPGPNANGNACGIHIHKGMNCTGNAGGHYYAPSQGQDPWAAVKYKTLSGGHAVRLIGENVGTGLTNYEVLGHTMIVHDSTGGRIACGILSIAGE